MPTTIQLIRGVLWKIFTMALLRLSSTLMATAMERFVHHHGTLCAGSTTGINVSIILATDLYDLNVISVG
jgi:hypothetical protein